MNRSKLTMTLTIAILLVSCLAVAPPRRLVAADAPGDQPDTATAKDERPELAGFWLGALKVGVIELRLGLHIAGDDPGKLTAKLDSIDQGVKGIPVDAVTFENGRLLAEIKSIGGEFEATLSEDAKSLDGEWRQGGQKLPLVLTRSEGVEELKRPQEPKPPYPYRIEQVSIEVADNDVTLSGTLTLPDGNGPFPAVVLISGSGPQDRDESIFGHKPFHVLADYLTRRGIAVLRYDDRGVGQSTGDFKTATTVEFKRDALAAVRMLAERPDIRRDRIGLCGHSEGGLIAPMAAVESKDVAFLVLLAAPGVTGEQILYEQGRLIGRSMGMDDAALARQSEIQKAIFDYLKTEQDEAKVRQRLREIFDEVATPEMREALQRSADMQGAVVNSPWFRYFLIHDPVPVLEKVTCPVLAINGELDLQVAPSQNLRPIEEALQKAGNKHVTVRELKGLNHLFQTAKTGAVLEYGQIEETFAPAALQVIGDWVATVTQSNQQSNSN